MSKYRLDLEVDGESGGCYGRSVDASEILTRTGSRWRRLGSGGCKGVDVSKILTGPRCRWMRSQTGITRSLATAVKVKV